MINSIIHGDNMITMKEMEDNSVDMGLTDPPYGANFMGKDWDKAMPSKETWREYLRVLKPGAFAFIMSLPRQDLLARMIINLEDVGFDVSFSPIAWSFAQGFPKSQSVSKVLDKRLGMKRKVVGIDETYMSKKSAEIKRGVDNTNRCYQNGGRTDSEAGFQNPIEGGFITSPATPEAQVLDGAYTKFSPKPAYEMVLVCQKPHTAKHKRSDVYSILDKKYDYWYTQNTKVTEKNIDKFVKKWERAFEEGEVIERRLALNPELQDEIILNRKTVLWSKPYKDTDITSSITHALDSGKGITWLSRGRIPYESDDDLSTVEAKCNFTEDSKSIGFGTDETVYGTGSTPLEQANDCVKPQGRFSPNLLVSDNCLDIGKITKSAGGNTTRTKKDKVGDWGHDDFHMQGYGDSGDFSRYFSLDKWAEKNLPTYLTFPFVITPKPSKAEKNSGLDGLSDKQMYKCDNSGESLEIFGTTDGGRKPRKNNHATVKPIKLGAYLVAIGSRPGDVVYDPYCGSGSFCVSAAVMERKYIGNEIDEEMVDIAEKRIAWHLEKKAEEESQMKFSI